GDGELEGFLAVAGLGGLDGPHHEAGAAALFQTFRIGGRVVAGAVKLGGVARIVADALVADARVTVLLPVRLPLRAERLGDDRGS
ncbi:MAG TPA: hypothetical protein VFY90_01210, partial [Tepidiformaceae bacterium]|nr:hypothetical protein [Tepidiformaceae bacterium]